MKTLKIYFTSDLHGYIFPTNYADTAEKDLGLLKISSNIIKDDNTLIIDGGDTIQGSAFMTYLSYNNTFDVHPLANLMNNIGYDYITLGNHDFNYGEDYLKSYLDNIDATCLCANVKHIPEELKVLPYDIKTMANGLKVGLIGFTTEFINTWEKEENLLNFQITKPYELVKDLTNTLKNQVDILIGIYHGGFEKDIHTGELLGKDTGENEAYKIAENLDFDLLLTGHQHMDISNHTINNTQIVQTLHNGQNFVEINITFDKTIKYNIRSKVPTGKVNAVPNELLEIETNVQKWLDKPIGKLNTSLLPDSHLDMALNGSYLANFINQIQLDISGADISCTSFANDIKGFDSSVTVRDVVSTYVYPNTLTVLKVTGKVLRMALERCASYFDIVNNEVIISDRFLKPKVEHYNYDYFSGIYYEFDITSELNNRVTKLEFNNMTVNDTDEFTLVMNNYRSSGAGGYEFYTECKIDKVIMIEMPEIIIDYLKNNSNIEVDTTKYYNITTY